ncbi:hypothetical protein LOD99_10605 [Oopsacas minuta]|uniref:Uncharacterized protein n=1 Tax=Oopsacas minuta TaxID=111878 RepID=A0AAV7KEI1_9METZ|nr:hypothetical protein LOD99_10605 [Oopsacas minuta]
MNSLKLAKERNINRFKLLIKAVHPPIRGAVTNTVMSFREVLQDDRLHKANRQRYPRTSSIDSEEIPNYGEVYRIPSSKKLLALNLCEKNLCKYYTQVEIIG